MKRTIGIEGRKIKRKENENRWFRWQPVIASLFFLFFLALRGDNSFSYLSLTVKCNYGWIRMFRDVQLNDKYSEVPTIKVRNYTSVRV